MYISSIFPKNFIVMKTVTETTAISLNEKGFPTDDSNYNNIRTSLKIKSISSLSFVKFKDIWSFQEYGGKLLSELHSSLNSESKQRSRNAEHDENIIRYSFF